MRDLLVEFAKSIIQLDDSLEILIHASDKGAFTDSLPSWVPEWTCKEEAAYCLFLKGDFTCPRESYSPGWGKAGAFFDSSATDQYCVALMAWGAFVNVLHLEVPKATTAHEQLKVFYTLDRP
ncbi:hypothetical protein P171DRAFT_185066 [Karstenula rhodostoma CBS 690.94]|uniref:Uncharacterized protein n=1 Tax=Karstenula rhodostoma CBS 690.94 TaxID=1392251 RepID=A0A9P4P5F0_9PLEO|nr:hypothetical protein P171DRAFT_185066 [Karstenula rhodostoma CBS 690.94]